MSNGGQHRSPPAEAQPGGHPETGNTCEYGQAPTSRQELEAQMCTTFISPCSKFLNPAAPQACTCLLGINSAPSRIPNVPVELCALCLPHCLPLPTPSIQLLWPKPGSVVQSSTIALSSYKHGVLPTSTPHPRLEVLCLHLIGWFFHCCISAQPAPSVWKPRTS